MKTDKESLRAYFHCDMKVREDLDLSDISKLVFSDIAYMYFLGEKKDDKNNSGCFAGNQFFANKYSKSKGTISKAVSALKDKGYILRYLDEHRNRTIYVNRTAFSKDNDAGDQISDDDNSPENDPQLPTIDAPMTLENQRMLDKHYKKKFPNISNFESDGAAQ